jgi:membrane protein DedA with SNARE-associated domain
MNWLDHIIRHTLTHWGYWAVLLGLLGENAGLPLPGETILMFASFIAQKTSSVHLLWVIVVGTAAAVMGDNTGYLLGYQIDADSLDGVAMIFWARFYFLARAPSLDRSPGCSACNGRNLPYLMSWKRRPG